MSWLPSLGQANFLAPSSLLDPRVAVVAAGIVLLGWGSRLYRVAIAAPGFVLGVFGGLAVAPEATLLVRAGLALVLGLAGAALLLFIERLAVGLTGALLVGGLVYAVGPSIMDPMPWFAPLIGAAVGGLLFPSLYRLALKVITPLLGALCIAWAFGRPQDLLLISGLTLVGAVFQVARSQGGRRQTEARDDVSAS